MGIMGTLAIAVAYTVRTCISVAIVEMVLPINHTAHTGKGEEFRSSVCMTIKWLKILIIISTFLKSVDIKLIIFLFAQIIDKILCFLFVLGRHEI